MESIKLNEVIKGDAVMESFTNRITSTWSLKILKVSGYFSTTSVGWQSFATVHALLDNLEEIDIQKIRNGNVDVNLCTVLLNAFIAKPTLDLERVFVSNFYDCSNANKCKCAQKPELQHNRTEPLPYSHQFIWTRTTQSNAGQLTTKECLIANIEALSLERTSLLDSTRGKSLGNQVVSRLMRLSTKLRLF